MTDVISTWAVQPRATLALTPGVAGSVLSTAELAAFRFKTSAPRPDTWESSARSDLISHLESLGDDWDGCGAAAITKAVADNARDALSRLERLDVVPYEISASEAGTILFEWDLALGSARLEIGTTTFGFFTSPLHGEPITGGGQFGGLNAAEVCDAVATITSTNPYSVLASSDDYPGISRWRPARAA